MVYPAPPKDSWWVITRDLSFVLHMVIGGLFFYGAVGYYLAASAFGLPRSFPVVAMDVVLFVIGWVAIQRVSRTVHSGTDLQ